MTSFKQSKFSESSKANGNHVPVTVESGLKASQSDLCVDRLAKDKEELIRRERIGLLEDQFVQSVYRDKGIPLS